MNERMRVEIQYQESTYEIDVNPHDKVHQMVEDLYQSILVHEGYYSTWGRIITSFKIKSGKYIVRKRDGRVVSLHEEMDDEYYRLEL